MTEPANHELSERIAVPEERMKTNYAETETSIERMNAAFERLRTDMVKRENRLMLVILGGIAVTTAVPGVLIAGIPAA